MTHLINKDAVVAEIEKIISDETESIKSFEHNKNASEVQRSNARIGVLTYLRSFLTTLEVKEVDLEEKACDAYCKVCGHYAHTTPNHICRQACDYYKNFVKYMKGE